MNNFIPLVNLINVIQNKLTEKNIEITFINAGGGLGIDYENQKKTQFQILKNTLLYF